MNTKDREVFEQLERDWTTYISKIESMEEIPWQAESVMAKMQAYKGDLPQSGSYKPDTMPGTIDKYRKFYISDGEKFAGRMLYRVPRALRIYVALEPIIKRKEDYTQARLVALLNETGTHCTLDQYKKRRAKAKMWWVYHARLSQLKSNLIAIA